MKTLLLMIGLAGCASVPARYDAPGVAYPMEAMLKSREVADEFAHLVQLAGYGKRSDERAAFLVLDNGHIRLETWPASNAYHAAAWSGRIPEGTVAIAHTHPQAFPDASVHDRSEAQRLGIPIFVLTPQSVVLIDPRDGRARAVSALTAF